METFPSRIEGALARLDAALESNRRWLVFLFLGAFVLKSLYVLQSAGSLEIRVPIMDAQHYDRTARDIASGNVIRREAFFMGPLYSYVLALVYATIGRNFTIVRLLQIAAGSFTVVLTYLIGRRLFRPSTGLVGALLLLFYGAITFQEGQLLMTWLGTMLNVAAILVLLRAGRDASVLAYVAPGILLGLSTLARANVLVFWPVVVVWIAWGERRPRALTKAAVFTAAVVVTISPATIHNYVASRDIVPVTSNAGINFYIGNSELATGVFYPPPGTDFVTDATTRSYVERLMGRDMSPSEVSDYWFEKAFAFIRAHPGREVALLARKFVMFFNGYEMPQIENYDSARLRYTSLRVLFVNFWMLVSLGTLGMLFALPRWRRCLLLYGYVLTYALSITLFFVTARYRVQIAPIMALFAAYALVGAAPRYLLRVRSGAVFVGLLFLLVAVTQPRLFALPEREVSFREHVHVARRASETKQYQLALREIDRAIELYPDYFEGYVHRAIIHKEGGNLFKAIEDYARALDLEPSLSGAHYDLAQTLRQVNMKSQAIEEYQKAIAIDSLMIEAYNNVGITYSELRRYDVAIAYFEKAIAMDPNYLKAYNNLGAALAESGQVEEAIRTFEKAITVDPAYANSYKNLAMAYVSIGRVGPALAAMERYLALVPTDEGARGVMGKLRVAAADSTKGSPIDDDSAPTPLE